MWENAVQYDRRGVWKGFFSAEWTLGHDAFGVSGKALQVLHLVIYVTQYCFFFFTKLNYVCFLEQFHSPRLVSGVLTDWFLQSLCCFRDLVSYHRSSCFVLGLPVSVWRLRYSLWIASREWNEASALFFPTCPSQLPIIQRRANQAREKHLSAFSLVLFY